tara:strand:+ start:384 stop:653 length:270 start_codon:yes stop_codon:yes gene_type:complete
MIYLALGYLLPFYVIFNLLRKVEKTTEQFEEASKDIQDVYSEINKAYSEMKVIDSKGGFQADDEVGTIFQNLKEVIYMLGDRYGSDDEA